MICFLDHVLVGLGAIMNLEQLEAVNAVAEFGSFRTAADKLNRSQPALSATIKQLEEEFEILIFDRTDYRPKLTDAGSAFLKVAKVTLESANYTTRVATELGKKKADTELSISIDPLVSNKYIEWIALECSRPVLPVNLIIDHSILTENLQALLNGNLDLAIGQKPDTAGAIESIHLENILLFGVLSRRLLQEKKKATKSLLKQYPQILVYNRKANESANDAFSNLIGHKIFVPDHHTKLKLIKCGIGWGRISKSEFERNKEFVQIEYDLCKPVNLDLCLLRPKLRPISAIARAVWKAFEEKS